MVQLTMSVRTKGPEFFANTARNKFAGDLERGRAGAGFGAPDHLHQVVYWGGAKQRPARVVEYDPEKIFETWLDEKDYPGCGKRLY